MRPLRTELAICLLGLAAGTAVGVCFNAPRAAAVIVLVAAIAAFSRMIWRTLF
ncbi:hypothetical protein [Asticcacaulis sp. AC466]|uniref:hypothetical protein n=1 Tax=Asticcacaulis sp. AC466 TaxID=1282362 RepID=UPI000424F032|nr:hypothetical protein [Asticcacaulis sp. AC466]